MRTPLKRLSQLVAVTGMIAGLAGSLAFAQETQPASPPSSTGSQPSSITAPPVDSGAMQPPSATPDTVPTPPEASPAAPPATSADTTVAQPAESTLDQALAAYARQDFTSAVEALQQAIGTDPSAVEAHYYLGYALYKLKRFDESRIAFAQVYQLQSTYLPPAAKSQ